ncbi:MAG: tRNA epoxyqueuosine(34) reductase QueG [Candidatus Omnitrophica bacterium]|nr:tRNA epoxyqueuosine(34) reductase QueG [Candidatus Omnitrophota bacterium]
MNSGESHPRIRHLPGTSTLKLTLTEAIKTESLRLGFSSVGIAPASALNRRKAELEHWLSMGFSGGLGYMESFLHRQSDLLAKIPDLKSVIVLTAPYANGREIRLPPGAGKIARYAHGKDYHRVIGKKLDNLEEFLRDLAPEIRTIRSVDTSAIQERTLAESAGLGFVGKNSCLIRPKEGSYLFLAALLTNLELVSDKPIQWDCGSCNLCLEACPTGALSPERPYQLDANKCISSLTIENRGTIPPSLRSAIGDWLFGCDVCQEVCPYNRKTDHSPWPEFQARHGAGAAPTLADILAIRTDELFVRRFAGTPLMRAKRQGFLRNAAVVAGNSGNPELIEPLKEAAESDSSELVREHAAWAIFRIKQALKTSPDPKIP